MRKLLAILFFVVLAGCMSPGSVVINGDGKGNSGGGTIDGGGDDGIIDDGGGSGATGDGSGGTDPAGGGDDPDPGDDGGDTDPLAPPTPAQIPGAIEYASGGYVGGTLIVKAGNDLSFVAKDDQGEVMDPENVIVKIIDTDTETVVATYTKPEPSVSISKVLDLEDQWGTVTYADDAITVSTSDYFPNLSANFGMKFTIKRLPDSEEIDLDEYDAQMVVDDDSMDDGRFGFRDVVTLSEDNAMDPAIVINDMGVAYACYRENYSGTNNRVVVKKSDSDIPGAEWTSVATIDDWSDTSVGSHDRCGISVSGTNKIAVGYSVTTISTMATDYYVKMSDDGGATFNNGIRVFDGTTCTVYSSIGVAYDVNGTLHVAYAGCSGGDYDIYHVRCTSSTDCSSSTRFSTDEHAGDILVAVLNNSNSARPMAVKGRDTVKIYTSWVNDAIWPSPKLVMSELVYHPESDIVDDPTNYYVTNIRVGDHMPGWPFDNGYFPVYDNFIMIDNYRSDPALRDQIDPAKEDGVPVLIWKELNPYMGPFDAHFVLGRWNEDEESFNVQMIADDLPYGVGEPDIIGVSGCAADAANNYHLLYGYMTMMDEGPMGVKYIRGTFDYDTNELIFSDEVNAFPETTAYGWPSVSAAPGQMGRVVVMWSSGDWGDQMLYSRTGDLIRPE